ncbi:MAG: ABC transporter permease [Bacteroidetes bacterium]|nr:ABC transporter permease [Bacteroidota bacterium]
MFLNYLVIAFRNIIKHKSFSLINVIGLSVAMAICVVSLLYISNEFMFDRFHANKDRIYRVILKSESNNEGTSTSAIATAGIGPTLYQEIPEIESMVRISHPRGSFFSYNGKNYPAQNLMYADSTFFEILSFDLIIGNEHNILNQPYTGVLTRSMARTMFDDESDAIGEILELNNRDKILITGIVADPPPHSHLQFDVLVSFMSLYKDPHVYLDWNGGHSYCNYVLLKKNTSIRQFETQLPSILDKQINDMLKPYGVEWSLIFQPLTEVHLFSDFDSDIETKGNLTFIIILFSITIIILFIACFNFINLSAAASFSRMKEVGVRKVMGAERRQIVLQFLIETFILTVVALFLSFLIIEVVEAFLPSLINDPFLLEQLDVYNFSLLQIVAIMLFILLVTGVVAGTYPALNISKFQPVRILKGHTMGAGGKPVFRSTLVILQYTVSSALILCTLIIVTQINLLLKKDLGYEPENKLVISLDSEASTGACDALKRAFLTVAGIAHAGASSDIPGLDFTRNGYIPEGMSEPIMIHVLDVDNDYLTTMNLRIVDGRNFSAEYGTDATAYIINQTLVKQMGWTDPVGKTISRGGDHPVIGVVEDFHYSSLQKQIEPLIITRSPFQGYNFITVSYTGMNKKDLITQLESKWKRIVPNEDFNYMFLTNHVKQGYAEEFGFAWILAACAGLALFIAGLGLFGLAAYIVRRRSREMAIRKIFGASLKQVFVIMSTRFMRWVFIANLLAIPIAWFIMDQWLQRYVYHAGIQLWIFVVTLLFCLILALLIISFQIIRIGYLNPVHFIRYE